MSVIFWPPDLRSSMRENALSPRSPCISHCTHAMQRVCAAIPVACPESPPIPSAFQTPPPPPPGPVPEWPILAPDQIFQKRRRISLHSLRTAPPLGIGGCSPDHLSTHRCMLPPWQNKLKAGFHKNGGMRKVLRLLSFPQVGSCSKLSGHIRPAAHCNSGEGGPLSLFPRAPPPLSHQAPRAGPTTSTSGRLKSLKHVISHINLANPVHHPFFWQLGKIRPRPSVLFSRPPSPNSHRLEGLPSPGVAMDRRPYPGLLAFEGAESHRMRRTHRQRKYRFSATCTVFEVRQGYGGLHSKHLIPRVLMVAAAPKVKEGAPCNPYRMGCATICPNI